MRKVVLLISLLLLPAVIPAAADQHDVIASTTIGPAESPNTSFRECFVAIDASGCAKDSPGDVLLNWWSWSDETNSNWPDDDAKARAGELLLNISDNTSTMEITDNYSKWCIGYPCRNGRAQDRYSGNYDAVSQFIRFDYHVCLPE